MNHAGIYMEVNIIDSLSQLLLMALNDCSIEGIWLNDMLNTLKSKVEKRNPELKAVVYSAVSIIFALLSRIKKKQC